MADPTENALSSSSTPILSGGAGFALNPHDPKDRALVRNAMKEWPKRWRGLTAEKKDGFSSGLIEASEACRELIRSDDTEVRIEAVKTMGGIVRTAVMMEGQNQSDEHEAEKYARIDAGLATERREVSNTHEIFAADPAARAAARVIAARIAPLAESVPGKVPPPPILNGTAQGIQAPPTGTPNGHTNGTNGHHHNGH